MINTKSFVLIRFLIKNSFNNEDEDRRSKNPLRVLDNNKSQGMLYFTYPFSILQRRFKSEE